MTKPTFRIAGMVWYLAEEFSEIRSMMKDGSLLPPTFADWQRKAEEQSKRLRAEGVLVHRSILRPAEFRAWCATHHLDLDAKARNQYAAWIAAKEYGAGS